MNTCAKETVEQIHELNPNRDAFHSINGYFYQFELTLLHILDDGTENDAFEDVACQSSYLIERIEDYVKYFDKEEKSFIRVAQIKHHTNKEGPSTYFGAVLFLYLNYLHFLERNLPETEYVARLFHYDESKEKGSIKPILDNAFISYEKKKEKQKKEDEEKEKETGKFVKRNDDILDKIYKTGLDSEENKKSFATIAKFIKTQKHEDVTENLKRKLKSRYQHLSEFHSDEFLYAASVSKLISEGKNGNEVSLKDLDDYFNGKVEQLENFYALKIIDYVKGIIDSNLIDVELNPWGRGVYESYNYIYTRIAKFIEEKFKINEYRNSFLLSTNPKEVRHFNPNSLDEYIAFTEANVAITQFLSKLSKIIFYYLDSGEEMFDLEEWFSINEQGWLFKYPGEQRGIGVITGDFSSDVFSSLRHILPRLRQESLKPDVWYVKHDDEFFNASQNMKYEHDYSDVPIEGEEDLPSYFCEPSEDHFHMQCLRCLSLNHYSGNSKTHEIFIHGCRGL
ncbi:hypothetical protein [Guptibacillus hwajinpoensis]|uniref:hypothetical protein n=1 Tax=Guptibacillus hwajinpoensis TaxID=208199 RepID=UPI001CFE4863|nr:hypothetical protein [Pseudalkalibacillus hwajinpoensis]WLR60638.1 hypothetical protein LC071_04585 [Pseudalkalibacillus hwajinpoensis]